jgi:Xaa-Pro aminopeptidase
MRGRGERLERVLGERGLDRILVTDLTNVRYLTGFTGTNGACVCGPDLRLFFTDFRYTERAEEEVEGWEPITVEGDWLASIAERLEGKVGFEDDQMSVRTLEKLKEKLGEGVEAVPAGAASPAAPSATSPAPPKHGSASSAPTPRSRRSSPPGRTGRCRTPSRASARSAAVS